MAVVQTRPYRRILTSALHRRFVHASALSLLVSYIIAIAIGEKSSCKYIATLSGRASKAQFKSWKYKELIKVLMQCSGYGFPLVVAVFEPRYSSYPPSPFSSSASVKCTSAREQLAPRLEFSDLSPCYKLRKPLAGTSSQHGGSPWFMYGRLRVIPTSSL